MFLRRLTESGIEHFRVYLEQLKNDPKQAPPVWLLIDAESSEKLPVILHVEQQLFQNRLEAAEYLDGLLAETGIEAVERDVGLWAWLTLFYFDSCCPIQSDGRRKKLEQSRLLPEVRNYQKYYRHHLLGPWAIYRAYRSDPTVTLAFMLSPLDIRTDIDEQLASRVDKINNRTVVETATVLYVDPHTKAFKPGARGAGKGSPRRLSKVLDQLDLTYDIGGMSCTELLSLLPKEFDRFKPGSVGAAAAG